MSWKHLILGHRDNTMSNKAEYRQNFEEAFALFEKQGINAAQDETQGQIATTEDAGTAASAPRDGHERPDIEVIKCLLRSAEFVVPETDPIDGWLVAEMQEEAQRLNIWCPELEKQLHFTASLLTLAYPHITREERRFGALIFWYIYYINDMPPDKRPISTFVQRFSHGMPQMDPVMDALAHLLPQVHDYFEPLIADAILISALNHMSGHLIVRELCSHTRIPGMKRFPRFLRELTGASSIYINFLFPKSTAVQPGQYFQALPEMAYWGDATNDILSFHKEEQRGELMTYVDNRRIAEGKMSSEVLRDVEHDIAVCRGRIGVAFGQNNKIADIWRGFETGYIWWHLVDKRFRLKGDIKIDC